MKVIIVILGWLVLLPGYARAQGDCEAARCAVQDAINQQCPCTEATNHGRYVSCVAHVVKTLSRDGTIPTNCKGKVKRCAAKSTCGKPEFVTCDIPRAGACGTPCTADASAICCADATTVCAVDADCVVSKCKIKSSAERCTAAGGTIGASSTCCADCTPNAP